MLGGEFEIDLSIQRNAFKPISDMYYIINQLII